MEWLEKCKELANSINISDRQKAIEIFATNTKMEEKKGACDDCKFVSSDKRSCNNKNYKDCNIFTNSLFQNKLDWEKAEKYLNEVRQNYTEIGASGLLALQLTINPLLVRLEKGEKSNFLYDEIMDLS